MTQHIEEARKLLMEIFRFCATEDKARDIVAAALAAAEERGRIEERAKISALTGYIEDANGNKGWIVP